MVTIHITTHMWLWWLQIAIDQEKLAKNARAQALEITSSGEGFGEHFTAETFASMIAVSGSAHSLDALYGRLAQMVGSHDTGTRWSTILEAVKRAAFVRGRNGGGFWATEFDWLFNLRDSAVHFEEQMSPSVPHPTGTNSGVENATYCLEAATRAVDLALDVLRTCITEPRPAMEAWGVGYAHVIPDLDDRRAGS